MSDQATYRLSRNAFGRVVFSEANGPIHEGVIPVRAFPLLRRTAPLPLSTSRVTNWPGSNS